MKPILVSIDDAIRMLGIGRTSAFKLINANKLVTVKIGRRTLVKISSVEALAGAATEPADA